MKELLLEMKAKGVERELLLATLLMWDAVQKQGIDPETVDVFGFDPGLMTEKEKREVCRGQSPPLSNNNNPFNWPVEEIDGKRTILGLKHNYVRLKTGEKIKLSPMVDSPKYRRYQ